MKEDEIRSRQSFNEYLELVKEDVAAYFKDKKGFRDVPCVACGSTDFEIQFEKMGFKYVLCRSCGTLFANPRPPIEDLIKFDCASRSGVFLLKDLILGKEEDRREKIFKPRALFTAKLIEEKAMSVIGDIGSGAGIFLEELKKLAPGIKLFSIEPSPGMASLCRKKGFDTIEKAIEEVEGLAEKFDMLCAFELLEHLHEPGAFIRKAFEMLKPGGLLLMTSLNCEGFDIQLLWGDSNNIYPAQHINFFNPRSIAIALKNNRFVVEEIVTPGKLDWDIVENAINEGKGGPGRLWRNFAEYASRESKEELQAFLCKNKLSSHMRVLARKG